MTHKLVEFLKEKKILILGFGREGRSSYQFIRKNLPNQKLVIADQKVGFEKEYDFLQKDTCLQIRSGENYLDHLEEYDLILKTPGISFVGMDTSQYERKNEIPTRAFTRVG